MTLEVMNPATMGAGLALVMFLGILLCIEIGRWIGRRALAGHAAMPQTNVSSLETAVFALMGLLIAFTFSGALTRFDTRRAQVVDEANAIGTAWLRIDLLPAAAQPKLRNAFRSYVDARIATYKKLPDMSAAKEELARSQQLQAEIWTQAAAAVRLPETRPSAELLVMSALNSMFDITTVRVVARDTPSGVGRAT